MNDKAVNVTGRDIHLAALLFPSIHLYYLFWIHIR
jgi:hypothetical protein